MKKIKLFTDLKLLENVPQGYIFPVVDYLIHDSENMAQYYVLTDSIEDSDIAILPVAVEFLLKRNGSKTVNEYLEYAEKARKKVLVFTSGDFGVTLKNKNVITIRLSGFKSKFENKTFIMPPFIKDPYLFLDKEVEYLNKESRLRIGFVGHSATGIIKIAKEFLIFANGVLKRFVRKDPTDYQFFYPSSFFRFQYLNFLKKNEKITCDFILRNQYRAGAKTEEDKYNTSYEFFKNIHNNPYTFCLRGGGNFSVRFYETLAMGRIPVLIDTDCQLPFFETINWSEHCLIVSEYEAEKLPQKLLDFHSNLSSEDFLALQEKNRMLWEKRLTKEMFFQELAKHLNQIL